MFTNHEKKKERRKQKEGKGKERKERRKENIEQGMIHRKLYLAQLECMVSLVSLFNKYFRI